MRYPDILKLTGYSCFSSAILTATVETKEILFLAGKKSHGYGAHEHKAGSMLLARCLNESGLNINAEVVTDGKWPQREENEARPDSSSCIVMDLSAIWRKITKVKFKHGSTMVWVSLACISVLRSSLSI